MASVVLAGAGLAAVRGETTYASLGWLFGRLSTGGELGLVLDRLAGLFLLIVFSVAVPAVAIVASWSWRKPVMRTMPAAVCLLLGACAVIVLARDVFVLVFSWELLTVSFYWLTSPGHHRTDGRASVTATLATVTFGKVSGAALLLGVLLVAPAGGSLTWTGLGTSTDGPVRAGAYALLVVAFAVKVGLVPLQVWMPRGYQAAPGPVRALMAGAAVNVGFYGLWRTLQVLGAPAPWLAVTVLLVGGVTALLGIAHASVQTRLTGMVAYSSVENAGLIATAYGVALIGSAIGLPQLMAAGLLAATLQVVAHALGKTLLFASAGVIESRLGTDDLDQLRGVARRLPWSGTGLAVGALTMAALPPTALFVSEWFILETLMQQFRLGQLRYALPMALAGALVALTAGFAGVAFARLAAFTALGHTATTTRSARDVGMVGRLGLLVLIVACPLLAAFTPAEIHLIADGLSGIVPSDATNASVDIPLGSRSSLSRVLRPVPHLAVHRAADHVPRRSRGRDPALSGRAAASAAGSGVALGDRRSRRGRRVHPVRLRQPDAEGPGEHPDDPDRPSGGRTRQRRPGRRRESRPCRRSPRVHVRRGRGDGDLPVPPAAASLEMGRSCRASTAVRAPRRLSLLHAHRPGRGDRRGGRVTRCYGPLAHDQ